MSDELDQQPAADRLNELESELFKHFGKLTRWRALCLERDVNTVEEQNLLAEEVLAAPSTGTNAEWLTHHLRLNGSQSFDVDEMLAGNDPAARKDEA